jgi:glycosyltransferase involved in cell wall biosynthesis
MKKVIMFASSHLIGLTSQLTEQSYGINKKIGSNLLIISGEKEQYPGLVDKIKANKVNHITIKGLDEHRDFLKLAKEFKKCVEQFNPEIVHARTNWQLAIAATVRFFLKKKYSIIYTIHGYRHNYLIRSIIARYLIGLALYLFADLIITPSSFLRSKFSFLGGRNKILFIGVDDDFFIEYNPPSFESTKRLIFPGEFRQGKNQDLLIRAIRGYIDKTNDGDIELYLPGKGEKLESCKSLCRELKLENKVFFPGFLTRDKMLDLYLKCQFAVIPTNIETFGHCITEPYVLGRVVISRHVGVADDIIVHGKTGFLYNTEDELLETLLRVLPDKEKCSLVSRDAFNGRDVFRWDNICRQYLQLIDRITYTSEV